MKKVLTENIKQFIFELYDYGYRQKEIAKIIGISDITIMRALREHINFQELHKKQYEARFKDVEKMYLEGMSASVIAKELHLKRANVVEYLRKLGYEILADGRKYTFNYDYFETIDTEEKAYWLGFLYADGCIGKNRKDNNGEHPGCGVGLGLKLSDENHIDKFIQSTGFNGNKKYKEIHLNGKTFYSCGVDLNSVKMADDLIKLGCVPRKSLILKFPTKEQVPDEFLFHFIRGYVDGDGTIGKQYKQYKTLHMYPRLGICGNEQFLEGLLDRTGWKRNKIIHDSRSHACGIGWGSREYLDLLYKDATIYLDRKYELYLEIIAELDGNI